MTTTITNDWIRDGEEVRVGQSLYPDKVALFPAGRVRDAIRVGVDELLEAIYAEFPDRRPDSSQEADGGTVVEVPVRLKITLVADD